VPPFFRGWIPRRIGNMRCAGMLNASHHHTHVHSHDDHGHGHDSAHGSSANNRRRLLVAAILTCGFMVAEFAGGLLTGSLALLADAGHMLTDSVALVLAYLAYRMSERPGTSRMTYGFDRLKILVAYTNGLTVLGIALWITVEAIHRVIAPTEVLGAPMLAIAAAGLVLNIIVFLVLTGGDRESLNLHGAILHVLGDLLGSVAAIVAAIIILVSGWLPADPLLSVLVAGLLTGSAWRLMRESGLILLEAAPAHIDRNAVVADLMAHAKGVTDIHHMHVWTLDGRQMMATLHARLRPGTDAEQSIRVIKARLGVAHGIHHATVEVETSDACTDEVTIETRKRMRNGKAGR
jgi:cobalt-zinc-cadmium efflux system protein